MNFGFKINALGFKSLVESVPYRVLKRTGELRDIEAILLGAAGFLESHNDYYVEELRHRYLYLAGKFGIKRIPVHRMHWKTVKVRPGGYPVLRIAQLAFLLTKLPDLFQIVIQNDQKELRELLRVCNVDYWSDHYNFGRSIKSDHIRFGRSSVDNLIINSVIPLQYAWSTFMGSPRNAFSNILSTIPKENNRIIAHWESLGVSAGSALESQGLIELYNTGCSKRKCLDCGIGQQVLNR
jgi:hypothetical protein